MVRHRRNTPLVGQSGIVTIMQTRKAIRDESDPWTCSRHPYRLVQRPKRPSLHPRQRRRSMRHRLFQQTMLEHTRCKTGPDWRPNQQHRQKYPRAICRHGRRRQSRYLRRRHRLWHRPQHSSARNKLVTSRNRMVPGLPLVPHFSKRRTLRPLPAPRDHHPPLPLQIRQRQSRLTAHRMSRLARMMASSPARMTKRKKSQNRSDAGFIVCPASHDYWRAP